MYRFFLHYNKPASQAAKRPLWSVHYRNRCHIVDKIDCRRPTESKVNRRQPYVVMRGFARSVDVVDGAAVIS
jgi:hypothetical protein